MTDNWSRVIIGLYGNMGAGCEAVFELNCPNGPPMLRENFGFAASDLSMIKATLADHLIQLCEEWRKIHGQP